MKDKLEPNMYVRLVNDVEDIVVINKIANVFETTILTENDGSIYQGEYTKENVVKASYNIIDLIEVGDYVDGEQVRYIEEGTDYRVLAIDEDYTYIIAGYDCDGFTKPIKSIVTKESMESVTYYVK